MIQAKPGFSFRDNAPSKDLFETVARRNGPLPDYHPQMLLQCLLWGPSFLQWRLTAANVSIEKIDVIKQIIVRLAQGLKYLTPEERATFELPSLPADSFLEVHNSMAGTTVSYEAELELKLKSPAENYDSSTQSFPVFVWWAKYVGISGLTYICAWQLNRDTEEDSGFSSAVVTKLIQSLEEVPLQALSDNENEQLLVLLQATSDVIGNGRL
jgi:hypothetical protein